MAVHEGVIPALVELLRGMLTWVEQRVAVRALGHLATYTSTFTALACHGEILELAMQLAASSLEIVYTHFYQYVDRRLSYHCDLLTRGMGGVEMESRKAEEWASQVQCWSLQLINCFAFRHEFRPTICKLELGRGPVASCPSIIDALCNIARSSDDWQYMAIDCLVGLLQDPSTCHKVIDTALPALLDLTEITTLGEHKKLGDSIVNVLQECIQTHGIGRNSISSRAKEQAEELLNSREQLKWEKSMPKEDLHIKQAAALVVKLEDMKQGYNLQLSEDEASLWMFPLSSLPTAESVLRNLPGSKVEIENLDPLVGMLLLLPLPFQIFKTNMPSYMESKLLSFQPEGIRFILRHGVRVLLADEMGLGKTLQVIDTALPALLDLAEITTLGEHKKLGDSIVNALQDCIQTHGIGRNSISSRAKEQVEELLNSREQLKWEKSMPKEDLHIKQAAALVVKLEGNSLFSSGDISGAALKYSEALALCPVRSKKERIVLYSNRAQCNLLLQQPVAAISDATRALCLQNPVNLHAKSLWRRAQAYDMLGFAKESLLDAILYINECSQSTDHDAASRQNKVPEYAERFVKKQIRAAWLFKDAAAKHGGVHCEGGASDVCNQETEDSEWETASESDMGDDEKVRLADNLKSEIRRKDRLTKASKKDMKQGYNLQLSEDEA
ncbi:hypothetical protein AAHA92_04224 [Salvia divinorum]|uniref:ARM repeat N-terminal plant domain-containing protein n=1 Tax=Salvia divinorum TaxID=28513 RepID=A0ABD1HYI5_SALDI